MAESVIARSRAASVRTSKPRTIRLGVRQYRALAEKTKAAGLGLTISSYEKLGCWGLYTGWALGMHDDVTQPRRPLHEHALITVSASIDTGALRAAGRSRPELDWSVLHDDELYAFVVQHELGHRLDNFDAWDVPMVNDLRAREQCHRKVRGINEVLADRFAWQRVRPGEPLPLTESGKANQEEIASAIKFLDLHLRRMGRYNVEPLPAGQYRSVPDYMLATPERATFVGPRVNGSLLADVTAYHAKRLSEGQSALW